MLIRNPNTEFKQAGFETSLNDVIEFINTCDNTLELNMIKDTVDQHLQRAKEEIEYYDAGAERI